MLVVTDRLPPQPEFEFDTVDFVAPTGPPGQPGPPEPTSPPLSNEVDAPRTRSFFPETWLFVVNQTKYVNLLVVVANNPIIISY